MRHALPLTIALLLLAGATAGAQAAGQEAPPATPAETQAAPQATDAKRAAAEGGQADSAQVKESGTLPAPASGTAPKNAPGAGASSKTDLLALQERIQARVAEVLKSQAARRASTPAASAPARKPAPRRRAAANPEAATAKPEHRAEPQVQVVWRLTVKWPAVLESPAAEQDGPAAPADTPRVTIESGPEP